MLNILQVKQPMFGANYVKGDVISEPDGEHFHIILSAHNPKIFFSLKLIFAPV